jgi:biotin carboxylase
VAAEQKRLLVLGAGPWQLPLIRKAVSRGVWVVTVSNVPRNAGHAEAHHSVHCSVTDAEGVLAVARELAIDGAATMASDAAVPALAIVSEQLGLPGYSPAIAKRLTNKAEFRAFQRSSRGLLAPFVAGQAFDTLFARLKSEVRPPLVFKAADTSGSRGISIVATLDEAECRDAFTRAQQFSPSGTVCAESFVPGDDVSGDGFLCEGRLVAVVTTKYSVDLVPVGHAVPTHLNEDSIGRINDEVERTCEAAGYRNGPVDFDVRVGPTSVTVIELSPRLGGNGIPAIAERATGLDFVSLTVAHALGEPVNVPACVDSRHGAGSMVFGSGEEGVLRMVTTGDDLRRAVPEVFEFQLHVAPGERVQRFVHSGHGVGHVLFDCESPAAYTGIVRRIQQALRLEVEGAAPSSPTSALFVGHAHVGPGPA